MIARFYYFIVLVAMILSYSCEVIAHENNITAFRNFVDGMQSFQADFKQIDSLGETRIGKIWIQKPKLARIDYLTPQQEQIFLNGDDVIHYNKTLDEITYVSTDDLPLNFLMGGSNTILNDPNAQLNFKDGATILRIKNQNMDMEAIFSGSPLQLSNLITYHGEDRVRLSFYNQSYNHTIDQKVFTFSNPRFSNQ